MKVTFFRKVFKICVGLRLPTLFASRKRVAKVFSLSVEFCWFMSRLNLVVRR